MHFWIHKACIQWCNWGSGLSPAVARTLEQIFIHPL